MMKRQEWLDQIGDIEMECSAARSALALLAQELEANPRWGAPHGWRARDAESCRENLETTYIIRLFAEFESGLRNVWKRYFRKNSRPPTKQLIESVAAKRQIPQDCLSKAHQVRGFRNRLVHELDGEDLEQPPVTLTLGEAKSRLCTYFSYLPRDW